VAALALSPLASLAQISPPSDAYQWTGAISTDWSDGGNWVQGNAPSLNTDALFGQHANPPEDEVVNVVKPNPLRSLWFDADSGIFYTLEGAPLRIGNDLAPNELMVAVASSGTQQSENNIETDFVTFDNRRTARIQNDSEGGLRFGSDVTLGMGDVIISGSGATHFAAGIFGSASFQTEQVPNATPAHLVLSGKNTEWDGRLTVGGEILTFLKSDWALGLSKQHHVLSGGTLSWRSHISQPLVYQNPQGVIYVEGTGAVRQIGVAPVGAIYNDGGQNTYDGDIQMEDNTWFGSRGDIEGRLELSGRIVGKGLTFTKVGPGLIVLTNRGNSWATTELNAGVLRITNPRTLGGVEANLIFGGGILELGEGDFSAQLGTGSGQVSWAGSGGFSAFGGFRTVTLNSGAALTWEQPYFVQDNHALLLGSRYANATITFANSLDLGTGTHHREIRTELAAFLSGAISGTDASTGLLKTGSGALFLNQSVAHNYFGPTIIQEGILSGISPNSNLQLDGGVFAITDLSAFTASIGTGAGEVQWLGSGGFASILNGATVRLGGTTAPIAWGSPGFVSNGQELRFGHYLATGWTIWDRGLDLGSGNRTIRLESPNPTNAVVLMNQPLLGGSGGLNIVGSGGMGIIKANPNFGAATPAPINLYGTLLRLSDAGSLSANPFDFTLRYGASLWLENTSTAFSNNRIHDASSITLQGGDLRYQTQETFMELVEHLGALKLPGFAANRIILNPPASGQYEQNSMLSFASLARDTALGRSTLDVSGVDYTFISSDFGFVVSRPEEGTGAQGSGVVIDQHLHMHLIGYGSTFDHYHWAPTQISIFPWATADSGKYWLTALRPEAYYQESILYGIPDYHTGAQNTWATQSWDSLYNVSTDGSSGPLSANRFVNSLRLTGGTLNLSDKTLTINSGGLLAARPEQGGSNQVIITGSSDARITTAMPEYDDNDQGIIGYTYRPLYVHVYNDRLSVNAGVSIRNGGMDLVKTGPGELRLNSSANHTLGSLYINQGTVNLTQGTLTLGPGNTRIYIGDGAGTDILQIRDSTRDQLKKVGGLPSITLHGTPYAPRGPEYGGDQAILRLGGNTKQRLGNLHIESRGTIDWVGGEVGRANMLWLDSLTFSGPDAILFMRNWYEYEDYLLVRANGFDLSYLQNIRFEGYEDFPVIWRNYDDQYYQITPFGAPEPTTTGAILGAMGIALVAWKRRKQKKSTR